MATLNENKDFVNNVLPSYLLDDCIEWIRGNLKPDDVFSKEELIDWAKDNIDDETLLTNK